MLLKKPERGKKRVIMYINETSYGDHQREGYSDN
jgi:hypothetical protein